jgi:polar amino acid transport system substrate-binding protein
MIRVTLMNTHRIQVWVYCFIFLIGGSFQSTWANESVSPSKFNKILKDGKLRVGVSLFTPWTLKNKNGELTGFEIDVAKKLSKDMGVTPEYISYDWEKLIPALIDGKIDIVIAGMAITPKRALTVNFSLPYATSGISLATNTEATKNIKSVEELNQKSIKIGVISATVSEGLAKRVFDKASIRAFQKSQEAEDAIVNGKIHAYMESKPIPQFIALEYPEKVDVPLSEPLLITKAGFAINKGDADFLSFLNSWIISRKADTWLESTHDFWFESLKWK